MVVWDHPRSRGVYKWGACGGLERLGSSPLARGLPRQRRCRRRGRRDHPRSRGVYDSWTGSTPDGGGSSPLARGLPSGLVHRPGGSRIIPARAGFTIGRDAGERPFGDHPRSRGVYAATVRADGCQMGSSPLARGLPSENPRPSRDGGIIPARAGFTPLASIAATTSPDHPRSRGVYLPSFIYRPVGWGSSPLARGLPAPRAAGRAFGRIIPARAGFTVRRPAGCRTPPDHPRSRGVYLWWFLVASSRVGSSPLARGLRVAIV